MTYMSPERIAGKGYSFASDIWSFGLTLLTTALGRFPLDTSGGYWGLLNLLLDEAMPLPLPDPEGGPFSPEFSSFIAACLQRDPAKRPSARELLHHPFITRHVRVTTPHEQVYALAVAGDADTTLSPPQPVPPAEPDESQVSNAGTLDDLADTAYKVQKYRFRRSLDAHERRLQLIAPDRFRALAHQMGLPAAVVAQRFNREQIHYDRQLKHLRSEARRLAALRSAAAAPLPVGVDAAGSAALRSAAPADAAAGPAALGALVDGEEGQLRAPSEHGHGEAAWADGRPDFPPGAEHASRLASPATASQPLAPLAPAAPAATSPTSGKLSALASAAT